MEATPTDSPLIAASDVTFELRGKSPLTITTGSSTYTLEATPSQAEQLREVLTEIVPLLRDSEAFARDLDEAQVDALSPYVDDFVKMGVLLEAPQDINSEAQRRFFTFLARRTKNTRSTYEHAREQRFRLIGPEELVGHWRTAFEAQGLSIDTSESASTICVELVANMEKLPEISRKYHAAGTAWSPVVLSPTGASIGPWVIPGETACPMCPVSLDGVGLYSTRSHVGLSTSWLSMQTGSLAWVSGLLTHSALRVVAPAGPHSPWGRRIDLDFLRTLQETVPVWKNPYCELCGPAPRPMRNWTECLMSRSPGNEAVPRTYFPR